MNKLTTSDRLKQIMLERNMKQVDVLMACKPYCEKYGVKLEKNDLSQYVSGKVQPGQDKLTILGLALNVNEVWLMGYNVPSGKDELQLIEETIKNELNLNKLIKSSYGETASEAFSMYTLLDSDDQGEIRGEMKHMLKAKKYSLQEESKNA